MTGEPGERRWRISEAPGNGKLALAATFLEGGRPHCSNLKAAAAGTAPGRGEKSALKKNDTPALHRQRAWGQRPAAQKQTFYMPMENFAGIRAIILLTSV
jgi:hypothetical protein